jgi:ComF family protein
MLTTMKQSLGSFLDSLLDFVYPPLCVCCKTLLERGRDHVCPNCWSSILRVHCGLPLFVETQRKLISSGSVDELVALFVFEKEGAFQSIAHSLKYSGVQALGLELGLRLGEVVKERKIHADALVPIPLHKRKLRERGYNQAELIARGLSESTGIPVRADLVRRKRFTQTQTALSLEDRRENMEDAFECESTEVEGMTFIVVDDVITTGATLLSCSEALNKAGAGCIIAASAALAQKDADARE